MPDSVPDMTCDHLLEPGELTPDGQCIHCLREAALREDIVAKPNEVRAPAADDGQVWTLHQWLKQQGDLVQVGDAIAELVAGDGTTLRVAAGQAGTLGIPQVGIDTPLQPGMLLARIVASRRGPRAEPAGPDVAPPVIAIAPDRPVLAMEDAGLVIPVDQPVVAPPPEPAFEAIRRDPIALDPGGPDPNFIEHLHQLRENGIFVVALIGFFQGGKTWLLNRLKKSLRDDDGIICDPPNARNHSKVARTNWASIHVFSEPSQSTAAGKSVVHTRQMAIIDLPGELVDQLFDDPLQGAAELLEALLVADALIIALPADEVLLAESANGVVHCLREDETTPRFDRDLWGEICETPADEARLNRLALGDEHLEKFTNRLIYVMKMISTIRATGLPPGARARDHRVSAEEVERHIGKGPISKFDMPTYIALTKADQLRKPDRVIAQLLNNPDDHHIREVMRDATEMVIKYRRGVLSQLRAWFTTYKFDFVAAFVDGPRDETIRYELPHHGVRDIKDWIEWCRTLPQRDGRYHKVLQRAKRMRSIREGIERHAQPQAHPAMRTPASDDDHLGHDVGASSGSLVVALIDAVYGHRQAIYFWALFAAIGFVGTLGVGVLWYLAQPIDAEPPTVQPWLAGLATVVTSFSVIWAVSREWQVRLAYRKLFGSNYDQP